MMIIHEDDELIVYLDQLYQQHLLISIFLAMVNLIMVFDNLHLNYFVVIKLVEKVNQLEKKQVEILNFHLLIDLIIKHLLKVIQVQQDLQE
eukprot:CAMPEP_0174822678 /NCGR_PEP_ID=MMETSP1107-20130205/17657_1 /TAXON_ID=36770 /ORGANISM="Paraphysomonas vestita, Strain GFlagA" /LENGTH=90 /DNA_ID=CAMNT_0016042327 /DNA_START=488 /DNA_END=760 /DNA_ORIENTATION=-